VPYQHINKSVDIRLTENTVEIFLSEERLTSHKRSTLRNHFTTVAAHMPPSHRQTQWREKEFLAQAGKHGEHTRQLVAHILESRPVPEQSYRSCLGILRLGEIYGSMRLEAAAKRAILGDLPTYKSVASLLKNGLDALALPSQDAPKPPMVHENLRGPDYYRQDSQGRTDLSVVLSSTQEDPHAC
jgi:hypothetical protein